MIVDRTDSGDATFRSYARVVWRRKWIVMITTALFLALALGYSYTRTPLYQASATLLYESQLNISDPLSTGQYVDPTVQQAELNSVASVIASPDLLASVREILGRADAASVYSVSAAPQTVASQSVATTAVIAAVSPGAPTAAHVANAYATAFVALRKQQEQAQIRQAEQVVQSKLDSFTSKASKQSADYLTLVQQETDLQILEGTVTGNFTVLVPATTPDQPFSPRTKRNGAVGLAGGLILGIAVVLLLEQFDTRVRTADEVAAIFGMPIIGNLHKVSSNEIESQPLVVLSDSRSSAAEAIRKLRGNLEFTNVDGDLKSLFITSALQHEGKSLAAANLALSLAATGVRVVLVDADLRRPQIHVYLNLPNGSGLSTVLTGKSDLRETIHSRSVGPGRIKIRESDTADGPPNGGERLYVLTSGPVPPNPAEMIASRSFSSVMTELRADFDLIVVDAPSVLAVGDPAAIARCVDGLVFLVDLTRAVRPLLKDAASQIEHMPCRKLGLVIVARAQRHDSYSYYAQGQSPLDVGSGKLSRLKRVRI